MRFYVLLIGTAIGAYVGFKLAFSGFEPSIMRQSAPGGFAPAAVAVCTVIGFLIASHLDTSSSFYGTVLNGATNASEGRRERIARRGVTDFGTGK